MWFCLGIISLGIAFLLLNLEVVKVEKIPFEVDDQGRQNFGLAPDHSVKAEAVAAEMPPFQIVGANGEQVAQDNHNSVVRLWDATKAVLGRHTRNYAQQVGDCVSFGGKNVIEYYTCICIARDGPGSGEFHEVSTAYLYGISRVVIGKGQLGNSDGSVGAWLAQGVQSHGVLALDDPGVPAYSGSLARDWGRRPGPPEKFIEIAKKRLFRTVSPIRTADEARDAICNYYPITIASDFGSTDIKNVDGQMVARRNTRWMHQMAVVGFDGTKGKLVNPRDPSAGRKGRFYVLNSWGETAHPAPLNGEPPGGFWIEFDDMGYITGQNDSWAFSGFDGFPAQDLNFHVFGLVSSRGSDNREERDRVFDGDGLDGVGRIFAGYGLRGGGGSGLRRVWLAPHDGASGANPFGVFQGVQRTGHRRAEVHGLELRCIQHSGIDSASARSQADSSGIEACGILCTGRASVRVHLRPSNGAVHVEVPVGLSI
jgi:hypothetical protein